MAIIEIGRISTCIAGDHRYSSEIRVTVDTDVINRVEVSRYENGAVGGMDGPGGAYGFRCHDTMTVPADPKQVVKAINRVMDDVIKRYGKPTKYFRWSTGDQIIHGLSVTKCKLAIDAARSYWPQAS